MANLLEGCLWIALALGLLIYAALRSRLRSLALPAVALIAFGCSDFVEMTTGAWWRPWWLLLWKAACVLTLAAALVLHYRKRRAIT